MKCREKMSWTCTWERTCNSISLRPGTLSVILQGIQQCIRLTKVQLKAWLLQFVCKNLTLANFRALDFYKRHANCRRVLYFIRNSVGWDENTVVRWTVLKLFLDLCNASSTTGRLQIDIVLSYQFCTYRISEILFNFNSLHWFISFWRNVNNLTKGFESYQPLKLQLCTIFQTIIRIHTAVWMSSDYSNNI